MEEKESRGESETQLLVVVDAFWAVFGLTESGGWQGQSGCFLFFVVQPHSLFWPLSSVWLLLGSEFPVK